MLSESSSDHNVAPIRSIYDQNENSFRIDVRKSPRIFGLWTHVIRVII